jgi:hypothetical protein
VRQSGHRFKNRKKIHHDIIFFNMSQSSRHPLPSRDEPLFLGENFGPQGWMSTPSFTPWGEHTTINNEVATRVSSLQGPTSPLRAPVGINFISRHKISYPGTKFQIQGKNFITRYEADTQIWNYIPRYETTYPGMKLHTLIWNYLPKYETTHLSMKLHA